MKGLGILISAVLLAFLGYQVAYPRIFDASFSASNASPPQTSTPVPAVPKEPAEVAALKTLSPKTPEVPPQAPANTTPPPATVANGMVPSVTLSEDPNTFHQPVFPPLEDVTKNWTAIPKTAFPRPVKLRRPVEFILPIGKSKVGAGGGVTALEQQGDTLIVAPTANSPARSQVALDDTDLKESLTRAYDSWKVQTTKYRRRLWIEAHNAALKTQKPAPSTAVASNEKPARNSDGSYPLLLASMKSGQVTEITPTNITRWGEATQEKVDGKTCWVVVVDVTILSMFGPFPTVAEAHIFNGKVEKWVYTKSREVVP